ncbi:MAG: hypothetical protein L0Z46_07800 [Nitrospiraceae bacterium]|nr:hypothetical protein [Nitrospiraceae bacterium]
MIAIRLDIPLHLDIIEPTDDRIEIQTDFIHGRFFCGLMLTGFVLSQEILPGRRGRLSSVGHMQLALVENLPGTTLAHLIETSAFQEIVKLVVSVSNRCIRAIRNFGNVPHIHEIHLSETGDQRGALQLWNARLTQDGQTWTPIVARPEDMLSLLEHVQGLFPSGLAGQLHVGEWPAIELAIQSGLRPSPEQEFITNAIEHLQMKNLRLALIESVIALEIVLTRYLSEYLRSYRMTPKRRIRDFLSPNFSLTTRLSGILDLTLAPDDMQTFELEKVMAAVKWRNQVTHRTGHLPVELPEQQIVEGINEVIRLTYLLGQRANHAGSPPEVRAVAEYISEKHSISRPSLWMLSGHKAFAEFDVCLQGPDTYPVSDRLISVVEDLSQRLRNLDADFVPEEHLYVRFSEFPHRLRAWWHKGKLRGAMEWG